MLTGGRDDLGAGCACLIHRVRESADPHNNDGPRPRGDGVKEPQSFFLIYPRSVSGV